MPGPSNPATTAVAVRTPIPILVPRTGLPHGLCGGRLDPRAGPGLAGVSTDATRAAARAPHRAQLMIRTAAAEHDDDNPSWNSEFVSRAATRILQGGPWLVGLLGMLILILRMPEAVFRAEFWAEDGLFYSEALARGPSTILEPYAGYFIFLVKLGSFLGSLLPPAYAPLMGNTTSLVAIAATAGYATSARMPWPFPRGVLIAFGVLATPIAFEIVGTLVHILWPITIALGLTALAREPLSRLGRAAENLWLCLGGATGIGVILVLPLFFNGPRRRLYIVAPLAVVQTLAALLLHGDRPGSLGADWELVPYIWVMRTMVAPLLGAGITSVLPSVVIVALGVLVVTLTAVLLLSRPLGRPELMIAILILAIPTIGITLGGERTSDLLTPWIAPRYFWPASVGFAMLIALKLWRPAAIGLLVLFVVGATFQFRIVAAPTTNWAELSRCIGTPRPCEIPVAPGEKWNVIWQP